MDFIDSAAREAQVYKYVIVASVTLVAYEYAIMFDSEFRYLWQRRLSFAGGLLLACRYFPFLAFIQVWLYVTMDKVTEARCINGFRASTSFVYIEFLLSVLVLFTRAYAVWGGSRRIFILLACTYSIGIFGTAYAIGLYMKGIDFISLTIGDGCLFNVENDSLWIALAILVFCESLALGLLLWKSLQHASALKYMNKHRNSRQNILMVMARDGIGYFACTLAITSSNLVVLTRVTPDLRDFLFITQGAIQGILSARLLFHIHSVNEFPDGDFQAEVGAGSTTIELGSMRKSQRPLRILRASPSTSRANLRDRLFLFKS